jgi:maleate isomerase
VRAAARLLSHAKPDVILRSGSKVGSIGFGQDADLKGQIEDATGIVVPSPGLVVLDALTRHDTRRIALVTPDAKPCQQRIVVQMPDAAISVIAESHLGLTENLSYASVQPEQILTQIASWRTSPRTPC